MKDTKQSGTEEYDFSQLSESMLKRVQKSQQGEQLINVLGNKQASLLQEIYCLTARALKYIQGQENLQKKKKTINTALKNIEALCGAAIAVNQQRLQWDGSLSQ